MLQENTIDRTARNQIYRAYGINFLEENEAAIPCAEKLYKAKGCLEQLGRWDQTIEYHSPIDAKWETDDYKTAIKQAGIAASALNNGSTVKQVEAYLRHGRLTGEWDEALLTATRKTEPNKPDPSATEFLTIDDLKSIRLYLEILWECVTKESTVKKLKNLKRTDINEMREDIDNLNSRALQTIIYEQIQKDKTKGDSV